MLTERDKLLRAAFDAYLAQMHAAELEPSEHFLSYDFDAIKSRQWHSLGELMVEDELREITNNLNHWLGSLQRWHVWNAVISAYSEEEAWEIRTEFLQALAHQCLLKPSAVRDALVFVVTNSMHQVRLSFEEDYPDVLEGDPVVGKNARHLSRREKEKRLEKIIACWPQGAEFMAILRGLDDDECRCVTSDYRNRNSHEIGPRLGIGLTKAVQRDVVPSSRLEEQPDGTYKHTIVPGKLSVSYSFGGTPPLDLADAWAVNREQFRRARAGYMKYLELLSAGLAAMPEAKSSKA